MYKNNFIVSIKMGEKIVREYNDVVLLPFGSEYSILLKNLNNRKALVDVFIDGESALRDNRKIIVAPYETVELEGFKEDSKVKHKFRFIEKTDDIKKYRRDKIEDGIIRVEIQYEKEYLWNWNQYYYMPCRLDSCWKMPSLNWSYHPDINTIPQSDDVYLCDTVLYRARAVNDEGITVEGSDTRQNFITGNIGILEDNKTIICLKLKGKVDSKPISKLIFTKEKVKCNYCGKPNNTKYKFCPRCGARIVWA